MRHGQRAAAPGVILETVRHGAPRWRRALGGGLVVVVALLAVSGAGANPPPPGGRPALSDVVVAGPVGVVQHVTPPGNRFGPEGDYEIYLPPGYGQDPARRYPVVYLLHGGSESVSFFRELGIAGDMDAAVADRVVGPMILVMVDGGPKFTGDGSTEASFDQYVTSDLIPDVDHRWRAIPGRAGRAIGGVSLGGRHALEFAATHPALVSAAAGHSTTIPRSPEALAAAKIPIYLDVGDSDGLYDDDAALARQLRRLGADVRWHSAAGTHGRPYWSAHLPDYLAFYSDALGAGDS